jgi:hypothetical protein
MDKAAYDDAVNYWGIQFPAIPEKTRGNIVITVTAALDRFKHGRLNAPFAGKLRSCRS